MGGAKLAYEFFKALTQRHKEELEKPKKTDTSKLNWSEYWDALLDPNSPLHEQAKENLRKENND